MNHCVEDDELIELLDGGVTRDREDRLLRHLRDCRTCSARKAALQRIIDGLAQHPAFDPVAHAKSVGRAIDAGVAEPSSVPALERRRGTRAAWLAAFAVAASVVIFASTRSKTGPWIAARGSPSHAPTSERAAIRHATGVDLWAAETGAPRALGPGDLVSTSTRYQATYRNMGDAPVAALVFAVDSAGAIHWLYPAYDTPETNPSSVVLPPTAGKDAPLPTSVILEGPAEGTLVIFSVLSMTPLRVSSIESRHDLSLDALRRAFPDADVESIPLRLSK